MVVMRIGVVGINHKSSSLELREVLAKAFQNESSNFEGAVLLSTCNRTELYFNAPSLAGKHIEILSCLKRRIKVPFEHALYSYFGQDCFYHLGKVISGVDSAILGESDIQRQAKLAYEKERKARPLSPDLHFLFQKGLKIGKDMRSSFLLGGQGIPLPLAMMSIIEGHQKDLKKCKVLFVGNSSVNRKLIGFFKNHGCSQITLCTRMVKGDFLVNDVQDWSVLSNWESYHIVICGTTHDMFVIDEVKGKVEDAILFDLSVPRNINPTLSSHPNLKLYNIDQVGDVARMKGGEKEIKLCENVIEKAVSRQMNLFKERRESKWRYGAAQ